MLLRKSIKYHEDIPKQFNPFFCCSRKISYYTAPYLYEELTVQDFFKELMFKNSEKNPSHHLRSAKLFLLRNFPTIKYSRVAFCINNKIFDNVIGQEILNIGIYGATKVVFSGCYGNVRIFVNYHDGFDLQVNCKNLSILDTVNLAPKALSQKEIKRIVRTPKQLNSLSTVGYAEIEFPDLKTCYNLDLTGPQFNAFTKKYCLNVLDKVFCKLFVNGLELSEEDVNKIDKGLEEAQLFSRTPQNNKNMKLVEKGDEFYLYDLLDQEK